TGKETAKGKDAGRRKRRRRRNIEISATVAENSDLSDDSFTESEDIEVLIPEELREYAEKIIIGKLSRFGFGRSLRLSKLGFYCVAMAYVASVPNFMMFNYAVRRLGFSFIFPFICCMIFIGFPITYLELTLGQYTQGTALTIFDRIAPISFGVGVSATILLMVSTIIDNDIMARMFLTFSNSLDIFGTEPDWYDLRRN
ncbi:hypothetical protein OSTOST_25356, partial [Ostertagia ostertagi]